MSIIKEPKDIDFIIESKPWTEEELKEFRSLIKKAKERGNATIRKQNRSSRIAP